VCAEPGPAGAPCSRGEECESGSCWKGHCD
jgi:hypothetical protein